MEINQSTLRPLLNHPIGDVDIQRCHDLEAQLKAALNEQLRIREKLSGRLVELEMQVWALVEEKGPLSDQRVELLESLKGVYQVKLNDLECRLKDALEKSLEERVFFGQERERLLKEKALLEEEKALLEEEKALLEEEKELLIRNCDEQIRERESLQIRERESFQIEKREVEESFYIVHQELMTVYQSLSWSLTQPLRWLNAMLNRPFKGRR